MKQTFIKTALFRLVAFHFFLLICLFPITVQAQSNRATGKSTNGSSNDKAAVNGERTINSFRSKNYVVYTDLSKTDAEKLLTRLETMLRILSTYWGAPQNGIVELYVAEDISKWPKQATDQLPERGLAKIMNGEGVTITETLGVGGKVKAARAIVYADSRRGTPEHEAVHAYCGQTFGTAGPVWYAEGMAEMGNYWREKELGVTCAPEVVKLIKETSPKKSMREIIDSDERTGDSWENYCWRWALCHLLVNNPNYKKEFAQLGKYLLVERKNVTFDETFGPVEKQIAFEYDLFLQNFDIGYRVDLCAWNWKGRFSTPTSTNPSTARVTAEKGWQPGGLLVQANTEYEYSSKGKWRIEKNGSEVTANGVEKPAGKASGRLEGIVLFRDEKNKSHTYQLSEPFALGETGKFTPSQDGQLFVRCADEWNQLSDNKGAITVTFKKTRP